MESPAPDADALSIRSTALPKTFRLSCDCYSRRMVLRHALAAGSTKNDPGWSSHYNLLVSLARGKGCKATHYPLGNWVLPTQLWSVRLSSSVISDLGQ